MTDEVFIGLGSNLGNGKKNLQEAWQLLGQAPGIATKKLSSPYLSAPVGIDTELWFTNAVGLLETDLSPADLLAEMMRIERRLGRQREKTRDRQIDLDLLYYADRVISLPGLTVPHPEMQHRLFVLAPLAEIAPDHVHPVLKRSSTALLAAIPAGQIVEKSAWESVGEPLASF